MNRYRTIVVDPPWPSKKAWGGKKARRSASDVYPLMTMEQIHAMRIADLVHPEGAHLWLWCTQSQASDGRLILEHAFEVARSWGAEVKNVITWGKSEPGVGAHFQVNSEFMIFGVYRHQESGHIPMTKRDGRVRPTWFEAKRLAHSKKPDEAYDLIERLSGGPRIDVFARDERDGWDVWGNEVNGMDYDLLGEL